MNDGTLLEHYARHADEDAFRELVRRHVHLVYSAALRQVGGDPHSAEDVTQVVFVELARKAGRLSRHPVLAGWLFTSTRFVAAKLVRRERLRQAREQKAHLMQQILSPADDPSHEEEIRAVLDETLASLKPGERDAVLLRYFQERSFADVGAALKLSEDAARMRVDRALEKMRGVLARRGIASSAAALTSVFATQATVAAPGSLIANVTGGALAAGGTGSAVVGVLGFLNIMSTTKITVAAAGLVALIAVGTLVLRTNASRAIEVARQDARMERERLQTRVALAEQQQRQFADQLAASRTELERFRAQEAQPGATAQHSPAARKTFSPDALEYALDHAEGRAAFIEHEVLRSRARFARFFQQASLTPEQQARFMTNLREFAEGKLDFMAAIRTHGFNWENQPVDPATVGRMGRLEKQIPAELQSRMRALLGEERFNEYQSYIRALPIRNVIDDLAGGLYDTPVPLTAAQASQLLQILQENPFRTPVPSFRGNTVAGTFIPLVTYNAAKTQLNLQGGSTLTDWSEPVADTAVARAASVLSPPQLEALRQIQARQAAQLLSTPPLANRTRGG